MLDHANGAPIAQIQGLRVEFQTKDGPVVGVEDVSFDINPGETVCVVGESGSGKSVSSLSLMRLVEYGGGEIAGGRLLFERGEKGQVDLAASSGSLMRKIRGNEIGMIFQEPMTALNPVFTIGKQMTEGLRLHLNMSRQEAEERALELMQQVRIPEPERRLKQYPHELSGGMRQRVVIAMALACEPRLLIADEPTTALDVTIQAEILALMDRLKRETGTAVMFITHDMAVVAQMADRVVVMFRGKKVEEGTVEEIFENPQHPYTKALLAAVPKLGEMTGKPYPEPMKLLGSEDKEIVPIKGREEVLLSVKNLTTRFPVQGGFLRRTVANVHAVEDLSFTLNKGQTLSLVGESGCGKSTAGRSILRLVEPMSGEVNLDGVDIMSLDQSALRTARLDMQMIFQDPFASLNPQMQLADQVAEPIHNFATLKGAEITKRIEMLFDRVELPRSFMRRFPHELSGGQRQRVAIARALALNPKLIIADEAVSALDVSVQAQVLNLMMELQAEMELSFLFISHDMAVVERVSHYVGVMYLGRIVEMGSRQRVFENPQHPYTQALMKAVPIADPRRRKSEKDLNFKPIPSPIHPVSYRAEPSVYREVEPGHHVLTTDSGY
ncbi:glutathione ABC transporter ATP-binding protein GsiA [Sulfitobacter sp. HI0082]|mgnify:FL=1|jgi:peptide/nickel transport system ATP-binding protein/glutathione transport system ATP-binding protein|uniref:ABC transporter ATP-binding protein n=1 Tax=unclassified Sulfitobacter TaxID=196795 RepID=UPI0007C2B79B|nr:MULTISPECIES: ABC transporter ATP-binding protein [unclassified Sulfitobacter]KZX91075.1 glutathione ABC transporter ATP-binding protein GsiA [Sulfitobacter sp. HI0021]KZY02895.1 glutathione ABC transporter ATP-binding protein GsiA [Sulfitobacter sp. HI0027]KZZ23485.1 glutathione ABC transporter ATP-binding protein GsiA [Sulfitobacter sp. HI0082]|tara:strand:- start:425 stop:2257 length:1833 start_codon:yes stop_codon:yes gene_type:complete